MGCMENPVVSDAEKIQALEQALSKSYDSGRLAGREEAAKAWGAEVERWKARCGVLVDRLGES